MAGYGKQYAIGKGKLFFDKFAPGTLIGSGERYLGNTPEITVSQDSELLEHFDADEGLNVKDEVVTTSQTMTLNFTTDNMSVENLADWFGADISKVTNASPVVVPPANFTVKRGHWYQLGVDAQRPNGARNITAVTVTDDSGTPVTIPASEYILDAAKGRIFIKDEASSTTIANGDILKIGFTIPAGTQQIIIAKGTELRGALRYISANPVGDQHDYFYPYVKLTSDGDFALKSDEWMSMSFTCEVLKKDSATERVYID